VLLVIEATVPITAFAVVFIILPTPISVKNNAVPEPVTVVEEVDVVIVPVRSVFGHAVAAHVPVWALVMVAARALGVEMPPNRRLIMNVSAMILLKIFFMKPRLRFSKKTCCRLRGEEAGWTPQHEETVRGNDIEGVLDLTKS
jgi:hypothetical protein